MSECREMGGAVNLNPADDERVDCHLDWCVVPQEIDAGMSHLRWFMVLILIPVYKAKKSTSPKHVKK